MRDFPEKDWKIIRKLKDELLERFCNRVLKEISENIENGGNSSHQTYLSLWKIMKREDDILGSMFDDLKRSTAIYKIAAWKKHDLITAIEFNQFSDDTKDSVNLIIS